MNGQTAVDEGVEASEFHFRHLAPGRNIERRYLVIRQEATKKTKAFGKQMSLFPDLPKSKSYRYSLMIRIYKRVLWTQKLNAMHLDFLEKYCHEKSEEISPTIYANCKI